MLVVEQWAEIRRLVLVDGRSQRQVARMLGVRAGHGRECVGVRRRRRGMSEGRSCRRSIRLRSGFASSWRRTRRSSHSDCGRWPSELGYAGREVDL